MQFARCSATALAAAVIAVLGWGHGAHAHEYNSGPAGEHYRAGVHCYSDGYVSVRPTFYKIGYAAQAIAYKIWLQDIRRNVWYEEPWRTYETGYGAIGTWPTASHLWRMPQSDYVVVVDYAWRLNGTWSLDRSWTTRYLIGGDFFGSEENVCRARPRTTVVEVGCDPTYYGNMCAGISSARRGSAPTRRAERPKRAARRPHRARPPRG
jgi:hypothetical protein